MPETRARAAIAQQASQSEAIESEVHDFDTDESQNGLAQLVEEVKRQGTLLTTICEAQERQLQEQNERIESLIMEKEILRSIVSRQDLHLKDQDLHLKEMQSAMKSLIDAVQMADERVEKVHLGLIDSLKEELLEELGATFTAAVKEMEERVRVNVLSKIGHAGKQEKIEFSTPILPTQAPRREVKSTYLAPSGMSHHGNGSVRQKAPTFDGTTTWEAYFTQFEIVANLNQWDSEDKAAFLAASLRGKGLTVLSNLPPESRCNFHALVVALESRFGNKRQVELNRAKLKSRTRKRDESLPEMAEDIERLARLAYPDGSTTVLEVICKDQFIDALDDDDIRLKVAQSRPQSLHSALEIALELESFLLASRRRVRSVRGTQASGEIPPNKNRSSYEQNNSSVRMNLITELKQLTDKMQQYFSMAQSGRTPRARGPFKGKCWNCGKEGHRQQNCTEEKPQLMGNGK